jgi:hypothetical protein
MEHRWEAAKAGDFIRMSKNVRQFSLRTTGGHLGGDFNMAGEKVLGSENLKRRFFGK